MSRMRCSAIARRKRA